MKYATRRKVTTTDTGTGMLTIGDSHGQNAVAGYGDLASVQDYAIPYLLLDADGAGWESGIGVANYDSAARFWYFRRHLVLDGSSGITAITLTAGTHTLQLGVPSVMDMRPGGQIFTSTATTLTDNAWVDIAWSAEAGNMEQEVDVWDIANPTHLIVPSWASETRISGSIAVAATPTAGRWLLQVMAQQYISGVAQGSPVQVGAAQFDVIGDTTQVISIPFDVRHIEDIAIADQAMSTWNQRFIIQVKRVGDGTAGAVYPALTHVDVEILR